MRQSRYTGTARALHWLAALLIFCGFGLGLFMTGLEFSPAKFRYYAWHKWIGITVFLLTAARLAWRAAHPAPPLTAMPPWQSGRPMRRTPRLRADAPSLSSWVYSFLDRRFRRLPGTRGVADLVAKDRETAKSCSSCTER
jgi:cytochrome b561